MSSYNSSYFIQNSRSNEFQHLNILNIIMVYNLKCDRIVYRGNIEKGAEVL